MELLIIDPQVDFMDLPGAPLPVPGATRDMARLAAFIDRCGWRLAGIHVTLDSHHPLHIAHPLMWVDRQGAAPVPYTAILAGDVAAGVWRPSPSSCQVSPSALATNSRSPAASGPVTR